MDLIERRGMTEDQELVHWWITTRFRYIDRLLARGPAAGASARPLHVVEFGCGTAQNLRYLRTLSPHRHLVGRVTGVDTGYARPERRDWMQEGDSLGPCLDGEERYDLLLAMDVLEHIADDSGALAGWVGGLAPGGRALLTVPAFAALWSRHDEVLGHHRRYRRGQLARLGRAAGLRPLRVSYAFGHLFPAVFILRRLLARRDQDDSDLKPHPRPLNALLAGLGALEAACGGNPFFGTSVIGLFERSRGSAGEKD